MVVPLLDLHGEVYSDVSLLVSEFILTRQDECPIMIMCGKSPKMVEIAMKAVKKIPCAQVKENTWTYPDGNSKFQYGVITILKV